MRFVQVARSLLMAVSPPVLLILGGKGSVGVSTPDVLKSSASLSSSLQFFRLVCSSKFLINGEAFHLRGLCLIWFGVTIFSLGPILPSVTSDSSMSRQVWLIIPLFRRRWMSCLLREQLNHLLMVLVVSKDTSGLWPILTSSGLIIICIYLLLRCELSNMLGRLFSMVIMLSPLIYRMLIYIFLMLSIIVISYDLFGTMCLINGRFYLLGWPQPLGFSLP